MLLEAWDFVYLPSIHDLPGKELLELIHSPKEDTRKHQKKEFQKLSEEDQEEWHTLCKVDTVINYGGRDSGKSHASSSFVAVGSSMYDHRVLYTRYIMSTTDHSISTALDARIELLNIDNLKFANSTYTTTDGSKGKIFITGQKTASLDQTAKLKSLEDFTIFVTDEAEEIKSYEEWNKIKRSMRGHGKQNISILTFNPPTKNHWLHEEFFENMSVAPGFCGVVDNVLYIHTTYEDNIDHVEPHNLREYLQLKDAFDQYESATKEEREKLPTIVKKRYAKYKHEVLGGFKDVAEGVIYEYWEYGDFDNSLPYIYGLDFGFRDPDACVKIAVDDRAMKIYIDEILYKNTSGTKELTQMLHNLVGDIDLIIADSEGARTIYDLYDEGLNIRRAKKKGTRKENYVRHTIKQIQGYTLVLTPRSKNVAHALNNYIWHDKRAEVPKNQHKHFPDAIGYAFNEIMDY